MSDVWESTPLVEEVWESDTTPGVQWVTVVRDGGGTFDGVHNDLDGRSTAGAHPASAISGLGSAATLNVGTSAGTVAAGNDDRFTDARTPTGGAGGALSGTYPNPGLNTESVQDLVGAMAGTGLTYDDETGVIDADPVDAAVVEAAVEDYLIANPPTVSPGIAVQGVLPAGLDVTGGSFTTLDILAVDGATVIVDDLPRAFGVGLSGLILSGANAGVWTITASGACTPTEVLGGQVVVVVQSASQAADFIGTNAAGPNSTLDPSVAATAFVREPVEVPDPAWNDVTGKPTFAAIATSGDWDDLAGVPARITALEQFVRPTVIFSRLHFGGDPVADGESGLATWLNPATGAILAPIYNVTNFPTQLDTYDAAGNVTGQWAYDNRPVIDGQPWQGGTILLVDQGNWLANGPWDIVDDGGTWVAERPTSLNGWVTDAMVVEGMPFWIGSGQHHRLKVGAWFYNSIVPTDPGHTVGFHRNDASDSYYTPSVPADWDVTPTRCGEAHDEVASRVRDLEDAPSGSGDVVGPASAVDGRAVLFDGTTGKLIKTATEAPVLEGDSRLTDARNPTAHNHGASEITGGTFDDARIPNLAASKITSGVFNIARLASGTPNGTKFVRDDGTLATPAGGGDLTHITSVGAQTAGDATAMNTGNGHPLLNSAIALGTAAAGDAFHFCGFLSLLNNSGVARNYKPGITIGSTFTQMTANFAIAANASTFIVRIEGNINVVATGVQQFGVETTHPNSTLAGVAASSATEDFTTSKNLQLHWSVNVATATQSVQLLSLQVWKVTA